MTNFCWCGCKLTNKIRYKTNIIGEKWQPLSVNVCHVHTPFWGWFSVVLRFLWPRKHSAAAATNAGRVDCESPSRQVLRFQPEIRFTGPKTVAEISMTEIGSQKRLKTPLILGNWDTWRFYYCPKYINHRMLSSSPPHIPTFWSSLPTCNNQKISKQKPKRCVEFSQV